MNTNFAHHGVTKPVTAPIASRRNRQNGGRKYAIETVAQMLPGQWYCVATATRVSPKDRPFNGLATRFREVGAEVAVRTVDDVTRLYAMRPMDDANFLPSVNWDNLA